MGTNMHLLVYMTKVLEKFSQCHSFLHHVFYVLSVNLQKLLHRLINYEVMHEVL